jgi:hypothetical protein
LTTRQQHRRASQVGATPETILGNALVARDAEIARMKAAMKDAHDGGDDTIKAKLEAALPELRPVRAPNKP